MVSPDAVDAPLVLPKADHLTRTKIAFSEINRIAASPLYGAPLDQIKLAHRVLKNTVGRLPKGPIRSPLPDHEVSKQPQDDLVNRLINDPDNKDLWFNQLLGNAFCKEMGTTDPKSPDAAAFRKGFEAYMIQDFVYCTRSVSYQIDRALKTSKGQEFDDTATKGAKYCGYAKNAFHLCIDPEDKGLGLQDTVVLTTKHAKALDQYTEFQAQTAEHNNWVMGLVAMIPCIQSYYAIANPLSKSASDDVKETPWYKLWIKPNGDVTPEDAGVTGQIAFFTANYDAWKDHYDEAKRIFQEACKGEIALWQFAKDSMTA